MIESYIINALNYRYFKSRLEVFLKNRFHVGNCFGLILNSENTCSRDNTVSSIFGNDVNILLSYSSVNLNIELRKLFSKMLNFWHHILHELLSTEPRFDCHYQNFIDISILNCFFKLLWYLRFWLDANSNLHIGSLNLITNLDITIFTFAKFSY